MIILRSVWWLIGVAVTIRFGYLFVLECGYALSLCDEPQAGTIWLALAYSGAALSSLQMDIKYLADLLQPSKEDHGD